MINKLNSILLIIFFSTVSANVFSFFPKTDKDFSLLPAFCKVRAGRGTPEQIRLWKKRLGSDYLHIHHFCAGLHTYNWALYNFPRNKEEKAHKLNVFKGVLGEINYMEKHVKNRNFILFPSIYLLKAKTFSELGSTAQAITYFNKSIAANKKYAPAYLALAKYYKKLGNTAQALETIELGLKYKPSSKSLNRLRKELTQ